MPRAHGKDLAEVFGYRPDDLTTLARDCWNGNHCPFVDGPCIKWNHDRSICYGACSVSVPRRKLGGRPEEVIICPNRLYANHFQVVADVAADAYPGQELLFHDEYRQRLLSMTLAYPCVVALREVQVAGKKTRADWLLIALSERGVQSFVGLEVQSIDTTGNYRDNNKAYRDLPVTGVTPIPSGAFDLNWANVYKRLIPQIIQKGKIWHQSPLCQGMYFAVPDEVYQRFEEVVVITTQSPLPGPNILSVLTYALGPIAPYGRKRDLVFQRVERVTLDEFAANFVAGSDLPSAALVNQKVGEALDRG